MGTEKEKCTSRCGEHKCQLPSGHTWKHRNGGVSWTDAGAARVKEEREEQFWKDLVLQK
jgi:hypothetical protein